MRAHGRSILSLWLVITMLLAPGAGVVQLAKGTLRFARPLAAPAAASTVGVLLAMVPSMGQVSAENTPPRASVTSVSTSPAPTPPEHTSADRRRALANPPKQPATTSPSITSSGLATQDMTTGLTATDLATTLAGPGTTVSNATYRGANVAGGTFSGGTGIIGFESGIILGSGNIASVVGPNTYDNTTTSNGTAGDSDLSALVGGASTYDAAVLEFDFVPDSSSVAFEYVFSSEEYNEYVYTQYDDVFGFFVNGVNCATVNGSRVSVNTINNGNPYGSDPKSNPDLYLNNDLNDLGGGINTEMDGLTVVLTCQASVTPNAVNHMKLAIADTADTLYDANVFVKAGSLTAGPPIVAPPEGSEDGGRDDVGGG